MSRLFPRGVPSALSLALSCVLLALLAAFPAAAGPTLKQNVNPSPAPNGIDTSIMGAGAYEGNSAPSDALSLRLDQLASFRARLGAIPLSRKSDLLDLLKQFTNVLVRERKLTLPSGFEGRLNGALPPHPPLSVMIEGLGTFSEDDITKTFTQFQQLQILRQILGALGSDRRVPIDQELSAQLGQSLAQSFASFPAHGPIGPVIRDGHAVIPGIYPASLFLGLAYYTGPQTPNGQHQQTFAFPDLRLSLATIGLDLDFQQYENNQNGTGGAVQYAFGLAREHYSQALAGAIGFNQIQGLKPPDPALKVETVPADIQQQAGDLETQLGNTLVRYTHSLQTSVYVSGRSYTGLGTYTIQGGEVGQLLPIGSTGVTLVGVAQAIQFSPSGGSSRSYGDVGQYGGSVIWQDRISYLDKSNPNIPLPVIRPWHWKVGLDYLSRAFGGASALPDTSDVYVRYKVPMGSAYHPLDLEFKPFYGKAGFGVPGQGHQETWGGEVGITLPVSL